MKRSVVLTIIGPDRPGLVEALAKTIAEHEANWEESSMARLGGKFAGILRTTVDADRAEALTKALGALETSGLRIVVDDSPTDDHSEMLRRLHLEVVGQDRPGIVRDISHVLASRSVNVIELETYAEQAPMTGGMLFHAEAELKVPAKVEMSELRSALEAIAHDLMVELRLVEEE